MFVKKKIKYFDFSYQVSIHGNPAWILTTARTKIQKLPLKTWTEQKDTIHPEK